MHNDVVIWAWEMPLSKAPAQIGARDIASAFSVSYSVNTEYFLRIMVPMVSVWPNQIYIDFFLTVDVNCPVLEIISPLSDVFEDCLVSGDGSNANFNMIIIRRGGEKSFGITGCSTAKFQMRSVFGVT